MGLSEQGAGVLRLTIYLCKGASRESMRLYFIKSCRTSSTTPIPRVASTAKEKSSAGPVHRRHRYGALGEICCKGAAVLGSIDFKYDFEKKGDLCLG